MEETRVKSVASLIMFIVVIPVLAFILVVATIALSKVVSNEYVQQTINIFTYVGFIAIFLATIFAILEILLWLKEASEP